MYNLEGLFLFKGLSSADKESLILSLSDYKQYQKGQSVYTAESFQNAMGIFINGTAEAVTDNVIKKNFSQGDIFGVASMFGAGDRYISEIIAKTECTILFISQQQLENIFAKYPIVSVNYITFLTDRIRYLNQKIKLYTCKGASAKLYLYLCNNADDNNIVKISNMTSLAKLTSLGRTSLYRAVDELCSNGLIERNNKIIRVK